MHACLLLPLYKHTCPLARMNEHFQSHTHIHVHVFNAHSSTVFVFEWSPEALQRTFPPSHPHTRWWCQMVLHTLPLSPSPLPHCLSITGRTVSSQSVSLEGGGGHKKYSLGLVIHCMCVCLYWKRGRLCRGIMYVCLHVDVSKTKRER